MPTTNIIPRTVSAPTVGTSAVLVIPPNPSRDGLFVYNPNLAATIAISPADSTPVINGPGTVTLAAGTGITLGADFPFTQGLNAIASLAAQAITVWEF
jgi:hypothetical protein